MQYINIILIAMFIEAIVTAIKPLWSKEDGKKMSVAEIVSIVIGIVLAVSCKLNMLAYFADETFLTGAPPWVLYIFYVLTGIALGRGPSFIWDLWQHFKEASGGSLLPIQEAVPVEETLPPIEDWPLEMLADFCRLNTIPCDGCKSKEDYINAILGARKPAAVEFVEEVDEEPTDEEPIEEPVSHAQEPPDMEPVTVD